MRQWRTTYVCCHCFLWSLYCPYCVYCLCVLLVSTDSYQITQCSATLLERVALKAAVHASDFNGSLPLILSLLSLLADIISVNICHHNSSSSSLASFSSITVADWRFFTVIFAFYQWKISGDTTFYPHLFLHLLRLPCQRHLQITSIVLANYVKGLSACSIHLI